MELRLEPHVGGRLLEVYDAGTGEGFEIGRALAWGARGAPGVHLAADDWAASEFTEVEVRFEAAGSGTRVTVEHSG